MGTIPTGSQTGKIKHGGPAGPPSPRVISLRQAVEAGRLKPRDLRLAAYAGDADARVACGTKLSASPDLRKWVNGLRPWGHLAFTHAVYAAGKAIHEYECHRIRLPAYFLHDMGNIVWCIGLITSYFDRSDPRRMMVDSERKLLALFERQDSKPPVAQQIFTALMCALKTVNDAALAHEHCYECLRTARHVAGNCQDIANCMVMQAVRQHLIRWALGSALN